MPHIRSFALPRTRLPFLSSELAPIRRAGETWLAASALEGPEGGRLFLIDPQSGEHEERPLPAGELGARMLQTGPDARLYIGGGQGRLLRYDPNTDELETLSQGDLQGAVSSGCVTDRYVVWTAEDGQAGVYDWWRSELLRVFKPWESERSAPWLGPRVTEAPDGRVLFTLNAPPARVALLDPASGARDVHVLEELAGQGGTRDAVFLDAQTLALFTATELLTYTYPSLELRGRVALPEGAGEAGARGTPCGKRYYMLSSPAGSLYRLGAGRCAWELERRGCIAESPALLAALDPGLLVALNASGKFFRVDLSGGPVFSHDLDVWGALGVEAFRPVPELQKVFGVGSGNLRLWQIDTSTQLSKDLARAAPGGWVAGMVWDPATRRLLLACGPSGSVNAYDPARTAPGAANPVVIARSGEAQGRPVAFVHDGRYAWLATGPPEGQRDGALTRIDPKDGDVRTWRLLLENLSPGSLVSDPSRRRLYLSMRNESAGSASAADGARLLAFDTQGLKVVGAFSPPGSAGEPKLLALLAPGRVLGLRRERLFTWEPEAGNFQDLGLAPKGMQEAVVAPNGTVYTCAVRHIARLNIGKDSFSLEALAPGAGRFFSLVGTHLWYVEGREVRALSVG